MLGLGLGVPRMSRITLEIGDTYQGGIVFYLDGNGGLIAAPADETASIWGCAGSIISGADGTAIGTGAQNTIDINAGCTVSDIATDIIAEKSLSGYTDWFLPSINELDAMHDNLHAAGLGGFDTFNSYYWSSTEYNDQHAWIQNFATGAKYINVSKGNSRSVRAIRAF